LFSKAGSASSTANRGDLSFLGWLAWNQWRVWRYSRWLAKPADGKPLSTNAQLGSSKGLRKHPAHTPEYARVSRNHHSAAEVIEEFAKPMSVGVTALSRLS